VRHISELFRRKPGEILRGALAELQGVGGGPIAETEFDAFHNLILIAVALNPFHQASSPDGEG
jgi:hypothetical protein